MIGITKRDRTREFQLNAVRILRTDASLKMDSWQSYPVSGKFGQIWLPRQSRLSRKFITFRLNLRINLRVVRGTKIVEVGIVISTHESECAEH
jgi:hypothetical protein